MVYKRSVAVVRLSTTNRRAPFKLLLGILSLCLLFHLKSQLEIIEILGKNFSQKLSSNIDVPSTTATTTTTGSNPTTTCSWLAPVHDSVNNCMDWTQHHFFSLFRSLHNEKNNMTREHNTTCPEHRLMQAAHDISYYLYPQAQIFSNPRYYLENLISNDFAKNPRLNAHHRVDAWYENYIFQALFNHSKRVDRHEDANLIVVPVPFGSICLDTISSHKDKRIIYNEIRDYLLQSTPYQQGKPHVLVSTTNPVLDIHRKQYIRLGRRLYDAIQNMTIGRGDDHYAACYTYIHNATPTIDFRGFDELFLKSEPITEHIFSVGLGGQALDLPLMVASWEKFQHSSLFLFYHTRSSPPFDGGSDKFRFAPIVNVSSTSLPPSSIGWSLPKDEWSRNLTDSKFCLVIRGDTPHSHLLFNAVKVGCLPVVVSDWYPLYAPPFAATLDMRDFCVFLSEEAFLANPETSLMTLNNIPDDVIKYKLQALRWAQRVMLVDHPDSLFVPAFLHEAVSSFSRSKSQLLA